MSFEVRPRSQPLSLRLLLVAASGLVPLAIVLAWGVDYLIDERRAQSQRTLLERSRALATAVDAELRSTTTLLHHLGTADELERADLQVFRASARRTAEQLGWHEVTLADAEGRILLRTTDALGKSNAGSIQPQSLARVMGTNRALVTHLVETTDQPIGAFAVRVPVVRSGKLVYVLSAVLSTSTMRAVLARPNIPSGVASVFDQGGRAVARSHGDVSPSASASLQKLLDRGDEQGVGRTINWEGIENYTAYTRLKDSGWVVVAGDSVAHANEGLYSLMRAVALGLAASLGLAAMLAWVLSRRILGPIDALKHGAAALGRGEIVHVPALDIEELDEVARALKDAAADRDRAASEVAAALRAAEEANRTKDQFMAVLGHELRNPLAPIATAIRLMALKGDEKTADERRIVERQLGHVTRLVDDLLDVSRITSNRLEIRRVPIRLAHVLTQVVESIRSSIEQHTLTLDIAPEMDEAWVAGDEVRVVQVFNNLLVNAVKFTPAGGAIRVRCTGDSHKARVDVEDTGIGMGPSDLARIFDLFFQGPQGSDRAKGGLGLGLSIVKSLVEMHGGSVSASSAGVGHGSCMSVDLPLCQAPGFSDEASAPEEARGSSKILVVDDNEDAADTCAALLDLYGYTVRVAYTPEGALKMLRDFIPDVAILDIGLPGMSGYMLASKMKQAPSAYAGKLVALTGYGQTTDMAMSKRAGFDAHLTKPVLPAELLETVRRFSSATSSHPLDRSAS